MAGGVPQVMRVVSPDGTPIGCERRGDGRPLLLVHGTAGDRTRWAALLDALAQAHTVYALDRRGRGLTGDTAEYAVEREFEDIAAVVEALDARVDVFGHSYGALCALEAARLTRAIRRLMLYEPPIPLGERIYPRGLAERLKAMLAAGEREAVVETFLREVPRIPEETLQIMRAAPTWGGRVAAAHTIPREMRLDDDYAFVPARFADVRVPTLLLLGGESPPIFARGIEALADSLPDAEVTVLAGQRHVAMDTAPELFLETVERFVGGR
jgi:pimeloyl-ACP methyl ester carboxylesterase